MKLFGLKNRSIHARKAPATESGKYDIYELAVIVDEFDAVGSIGFAIRSDELVNPKKEAERQAKKEAAAPVKEAEASNN